MPYHVVHISPDQRAQAQDLKFTVWRGRTPPPEGQFASVYAVNLDTLYTTDKEVHATLKTKFSSSEFISGVVYIPNLSGKDSTTANKDGDFDTWHLVRRKRPKKPSS